MAKEIPNLYHSLSAASFHVVILSVCLPVCRIVCLGLRRSIALSINKSQSDSLLVSMTHCGRFFKPSNVLSMVLQIVDIFVIRKVANHNTITCACKEKKDCISLQSLASVSVKVWPPSYIILLEGFGGISRLQQWVLYQIANLSNVLDWDCESIQCA